MAKKALSKKEIESIFRNIANDEAKKVCGQDQCMACYQCGHTNKPAKPVHRLIGTNQKCPLEHYNVTPDTRSFARRLMDGEETVPPEEELTRLFAICACCSHASGVIETKDGYELDRSEQAYYDYCVDCPVKACMNAIEENMAEAHMG